MERVREDVELSDLVKTLDSLVLSLATYGIPLKHSNIEVASHNDCLEMLHCHSDGPCADEGIID